MGHAKRKNDYAVIDIIFCYFVVDYDINRLLSIVIDCYRLIAASLTLGKKFNIIAERDCRLVWVNACK